jgi:hypothetical protein
MAVNDGEAPGWPFVNHAMQVRGTQTVRGRSRQSIVYPRSKFTFIVEFILSPNALSTHRVQTNLGSLIQSGRLFATMRSIDHPQATMNVEKLRSYNKNVIIPTRMDYAPASIGFHDDNSSMAMTLWREYRAFYQNEGALGEVNILANDPDGVELLNFRAGNNLIGNDVRGSQDYLSSLGMTIKANDSRHFFDAIQIYDLGADPDSVNVYKYLHPVITALSHDGLDYEDRAGLVGVNMSFEYEGYYHLVGQNNRHFTHTMEQQLNRSPNTTSENVEGHGKMFDTERRSFDADIGIGFPVDGAATLLDTLQGISQTTFDTPFFNEATVATAVATAIANTGLGSDIELTPAVIADLLTRTGAL